MNFDQVTAEFFRTVGYNLPGLAVLSVGAVVTWSTWNRHPPAARWAMLGFVSRIITDFINIGWHTFGFFWVFANMPGLLRHQYAIALTISSFEAIGYFFLILALNAARTPYRPPEFYDQFLDDDRRPPPADSGAFSKDRPV